MHNSKLLKGSVEQSDLGLIAEEFETSGRGPGTHSSGLLSDGSHDPGGPSYGLYQLTSQDSWRDRKGKLHVEHNGGNVDRFLSSEGKEWAKEFGTSKPGDAEFNQHWEEIASREQEAFAAAQSAYIGRTHFEPQARRIEDGTGIDVSDRSVTLQNVVWSTAVQHGPNTELISRSLNEKAEKLNKEPSQLTDRECIDAIYDERKRVNPGDSRRYEREHTYATRMLDAEENSPQKSLRSYASEQSRTGLEVPRELSQTLNDAASIPVASELTSVDAFRVPDVLSEKLTGIERCSDKKETEDKTVKRSIVDYISGFPGPRES